MLQHCPDMEKVPKTIFLQTKKVLLVQIALMVIFPTWDIVGLDVSHVVQDFFVGAKLPKGYSTMLMSSILKVINPSSCPNFRPISLCNFVCKILLKLFAFRLDLVLPKIIFPQQNAFLQGRVISNNVLLIQELCGELNRKVKR